MTLVVIEALSGELTDEMDMCNNKVEKGFEKKIRVLVKKVDFFL